MTGDDDDDDEGGSGDEGEDGVGEGKEKEEPTPTVADYVIHFLTLFWKLMFAFVPPTGEFFKLDCKLILKQKLYFLNCLSFLLSSCIKKINHNFFIKCRRQEKRKFLLKIFLFL